MKPIEHYWSSLNPVSLALLPLSLLFCLLAGFRRGLFALGLKRTVKLPVPVVVVGNISVGGTGKTPLVVWICKFLQAQGLKPGIVSRGYGGNASHWPKAVAPDSDPSEIGDEPLLLARRTQCPVFVGPNRPEAAQALLDQHQCDIIISDDGLQHYALQRDIEVAVVDGQRLFGNGLCLPAGPLREWRKRLQQVDLVVSNGTSPLSASQMNLQATVLVNVKDPSRRQTTTKFAPRTVNAAAGIGNPQRFFDTLKALGFESENYSFADHHNYQRGDMPTSDKRPLIMTEKDAVKCREFAEPEYWYLEVEAIMDDNFATQLKQLIRDL